MPEQAQNRQNTLNQTYCDRHKAECFADIKGQDIAIERIKIFVKSFPLKKKALILYGPPGTGKTSLAYALARENNAEILELNASDLRNRYAMEKIIGEASQQAGLFKKNKILLVDEVDGITKDDRGGLLELISLIAKTNFPIIITANAIWDSKFSELRRMSELVELKELNYKIIFSILKEICKKENLNLPDDLLMSLAIKVRGDMRAALNDLQTIDIETKYSDLHERDKEEKIFNILKQIFKNKANNETLGLYDKSDLSLDDIFLWLEENLPLEYKSHELARAFDLLSRADVFRGRIYRQQYWRFLVYQNIFLSAGIASSKKESRAGFTSYKRPSRILKIWLMNKKNKHKKSIAEKYAKYCHIGKKRAMQNFEITKEILKNPEIQQKLKLNEEEIEFLKE